MRQPRRREETFATNKGPSSRKVVMNRYIEMEHVAREVHSSRSENKLQVNIQGFATLDSHMLTGKEDRSVNVPQWDRRK